MTQLHLPLLLFGAPDELIPTLMMGVAWVLNLSVTEWLIRRVRWAKARAVAMCIVRKTSRANPQKRGCCSNLGVPGASAADRLV